MDLSLLRPTVFAVEGTKELRTEVSVLVTPEDVQEFLAGPMKNLARSYKDPQRLMERVAETIAEEAAWKDTDWEQDDATFSAWQVEVKGDPNDFIKKAPVWKADGQEATAAEVNATRLDKYGRPLPPPPIPGQEQLAI